MHKAESIMQSVLASVTGLTTTGANVSRGRGYPVDIVPALTLEQGADEIVEDSANMAFIDRLLTFNVVAYVKTGNQFDTQLNVIREEVYVAVMADRQQGLPSIVIDTMPVGDEEPELSVEAEKKVGRQVMSFAVHYRHSITDAGA